MAKKSVQNMDDEEFMKEWTALGDRVQSDRERLKEFSAEHQKRVRLAQLNLSRGDLELLQTVTPDMIESEEKVGE